MIAATEEAQFGTLLPELYLFSHLRQQLPRSTDVAIPATAPDESGCDLVITHGGHRFAIEVHTPIELFGFQTLCDELPGSIERSEVPIGFHADVTVESPHILEHQFAQFWPYWVPSAGPLKEWFTSFERELDAWLSKVQKAGKAQARRTFQGPPPKLGRETSTAPPTIRLRVNLRQIGPRQNGRSVALSYGHSTDTTLSFSAPPERLATTSWGRKLGEKLRKRQAGHPRTGLVRVLALKFGHANSFGLDLSQSGPIWSKLGQTLRLLPSADTAYDLVVPCRLGIESVLADPIATNEAVQNSALAAWAALELGSVTTTRE